ncbi:nucleolar protein-like protein NOP52 variant [Lentithecium fluviatile CBS 122367]|uniref:Nucleolar protein-like protein NOP52 variant n=1 Tax=Lentithecium fluviatile CBS 122367 TaxID=1168545 RepID=A0A6G1IPT2_9PLEO|nr:nucleolar protein-like protein NOP52 variant [Lentithecium fluviatile CBS 122367]
MAADLQSSPFIKHLASSDKKTRDQALTSLRTFLRGRSEISELDLLKLWKGLFYCLWMQDKPLHQQRLSQSLASLPSALQSPLILPFLRAFWITIAREWSQIEALRLDKYLYLIRQYVHASFQTLAKDGWKDTLAIEEYGRIVGDTALSGTDMKVPNGLRFHVLDVWVDELERVVGEGEGVWEGKLDILNLVMEPVERLAREGKLKVVRQAAKECLEDERLKAWRGEKDEDEEMEDGEEEEWGGIED